NENNQDHCAESASIAADLPEEIRACRRLRQRVNQRSDKGDRDHQETISGWDAAVLLTGHPNDESIDLTLGLIGLVASLGGYRFRLSPNLLFLEDGGFESLDEFV